MDKQPKKRDNFFKKLFMSAIAGQENQELIPVIFSKNDITKMVKKIFNEVIRECEWLLHIEISPEIKKKVWEDLSSRSIDALDRHIGEKIRQLFLECSKEDIVASAEVIAKDLSDEIPVLMEDWPDEILWSLQKCGLNV